MGGRWRVASDAIDAFIGSSPHATLTEPRSIRSVFVANRGEIAVRIARTCGQLGIAALLPAVDGPDALDLLDVEAVVTAARTAGADAVHPGVGFLAENADFAEAVVAAGLRWVGPPAAAIRTMGDKAAARRLAASLAVPIVPGYDDAAQSDTALRRAAAAIGAPLLVKPAGGGGGKGMRVVRDLGELDPALDAARREAGAAFGDDRLILERYLEGPRHVEVQVLFDAHGNGVHLGERDCSIQRRHQKVLEETPSPAVGPELRARLGEAALRLAAAVGYVGAGTVEFLVGDDGSFHFLEMNTRLQVEHPVTEAVTGRDLVADQLRIAAGEELNLDQTDVRPAGHAVEVRLYAEDADAGFLPATGRVEALRWPTGEGVRVDAGITLGTVAGDRFDPLLAKIVAHGHDRVDALARLARTLDETRVLGVVTNLRFLRWLVRSPAVVAGDARIDTLARSWPPADLTPADPPAAAWRAAAHALAEAHEAPVDPWAGGWRINAPPSIRLVADGVARTVAADGSADDGPTAVRSGDAVHVDVDGRSVTFRLAPPPDVERAIHAASSHAGGLTAIDAPMPGAVLSVHVAAGDRVGAGDPLVTLEAMKMEHVVTAPAAGRVEEIDARPNDQVARGQRLLVLAPA